MQPWGHHLILDVKGCQLDRAKDPEYIKHFVKDLVRLIEMVPYGQPQMTHFAAGTNKAGWTVIQLIETSNIIGHFLDVSGDLYLDVFSCKDFEAEVVTKAVYDYFRPESIRRRRIWRSA
jgi:S-adenosylmethionine/arginine decarboxylase-like enzyme